MIRESVAVLLVGVILIIVFVRSKHYGFAVGALPVVLIPLAHLIIRGVLYVTKQSFFGIRPPVVVAFVDVAALALGCFFAVRVGLKIPSKRYRTLYLIVMISYCVLLGWAYVFNTLRILFV